MALLQMLIMSYYYAFAGMETSERPEVFPKERAFMIGSRVTFCCVLPAGKVFKKMYLSEYSSANMNATTISNQTHALTVLLNQLPEISSINVFCETEDDHNGAVVEVGCKYDLVMSWILGFWTLKYVLLINAGCFFFVLYIYIYIYIYTCHHLDPPDYSNLTCETRDLESVECYWTEGRKTRWNFISYQLLERYIKNKPDEYGNKQG